MNGSRKSFWRSTANAAETSQLAAGLAVSLSFPAVILLRGDLGSGKTTFVKGLVEGLGGDPDLVHSPTFSLVNHYRTSVVEVLHIDLYRLEEAKQQYSIGLDELLDGDGLIVIEWAEKLRLEVFDPLHIEIEITAHEGRRLTFEGFAESHL